MTWIKMKRFVFLLLMLSFLVFVFATKKPQEDYPLADHYAKNSLDETGSANAVTGVYLDYRLYDSLFESLLLLVAAVGIHYLNKGDDDYESKE